jgi:NitT/TauT family transport system ATP-binding protein
MTVGPTHPQRSGMTATSSDMATTRPAAPAASLRVRVDDVSFAFTNPNARLPALDRLSLDALAGGFTVVIGPNGCGKSTLLRLMAGLLQSDSGAVLLGEGTQATTPRPGDPRVGICFQQPRLLPWLTAAENVALPLAIQGVPAAERSLRASEALARVGLAEASQLRPAELSGGMAQRIGLARALINDPPVLLLDEPFSALDLLTREAFDTELQELWLQRRRTLILVTHSVGEAVRLADRVAVMTARPGSVAQLVEVDLPRPRPVAIATEPRAIEAEAAIRRALASVHPPELASWTGA